MESFDKSRVHWERGKFSPWYVDQKPFALNRLKLPKNEEIILIELADSKIGFLLREVVYHHIIQSKWNGVDFILTFCGVCNAGVLLSPIFKNRVFHFREVGVYNGQQIFEDVETGTLWNHLTGEALDGALKGSRLPYIGALRMSTFEQEMKKNPELPLFISGQKRIYRSLMRFVIKVILGKWNKNWLPPHFEKTLPDVDPALPRMTMGLAVKIGETIRFYPINLISEKGITDQINGTKIRVTIEHGIPQAGDESAHDPFQLFTRWYAFNLTYPEGELYGG